MHLLVTGGSRGIGAATALMAAERGWDVTLSFASDHARAEAVAERITGMGRRALALAPTTAPAQDLMDAPLEGTWFAGPEELGVDLPPGQKATHLYIYLTGKPAAALWKGMKGKAVDEECTGMSVKMTENGIYCERPQDAKGDDDILCGIGIEMRTGRLKDARGPC